MALGDPHGDLNGVEAVYAKENRPGVAWLCVGDVVGKADGPKSSRLVAWMIEHQVATVSGNHEAWSLPAGRLAVLDKRQADPQLSPEALHWSAALPYVLEIFHPGYGGRVATMTHSHHHPTWRDVDQQSAAALAATLGGPSVLLVGHSHRPRLLQVVPGERRASIQALDFRVVDALEAPIPDRGTVIVDAGSVAEPGLEDVTGDYVPRAERELWATYAVVDFEAQTVAVRRLRKP